MKGKILSSALFGVGLMTAWQVQAGVICTGDAGPADSSTPFYNGDLTDPNCGWTEVADYLGLSYDLIDQIIGSKTESYEDGYGDINNWVQDEFDLGTLTVDSYGNTSGTWTLEGGYQVLFWVDKYDSMYDVHSYQGEPSPISDSWSRDSKWNTSHISVYGVVPVPAAVWLFGSGLLGLVGVARRRKNA